MAAKARLLVWCSREATAAVLQCWTFEASLLEGCQGQQVKVGKWQHATQIARLMMWRVVSLECAYPTVPSPAQEAHVKACVNAELYISVVAVQGSKGPSPSQAALASQLPASHCPSNPGSWSAANLVRTPGKNRPFSKSDNLGK